MFFNSFNPNIELDSITNKEKEKDKEKENQNNIINKYNYNFNYNYDSQLLFPKFDENNNLKYSKEDVIKLKIENDNQIKEIALLKSRINKFIFETNTLQDKYQKEIIKLYNDNKKLESSYQKIKNEKDKYINNIKLLQINNNKLQNDINILKTQIENNKNNETKYINQISNLIQEINFIKEEQNKIIYNNNSALQNYQNEIKDLNKKIKEKNILEDELNILINEDKNKDINNSINYDEDIDKCLFNSINFINGKIKKILSESVEFQKGKIMKENKLYNNIKNLIEEFNEIKKLVNNKDNQIRNTHIDKCILIDHNKKLNYENNLLKQHINKLIINLDLYINQNHLAAQKIFQLENNINQND